MLPLDSRIEAVLFTFNIYIYIYIYIYIGCTAWLVELPGPGIEPLPPAVEAWHLNHWTTGEVHSVF